MPFPFAFAWLNALHAVRHSHNDLKFPMEISPWTCHWGREWLKGQLGDENLNTWHWWVILLSLLLWQGNHDTIFHTFRVGSLFELTLLVLLHLTLASAERHCIRHQVEFEEQRCADLGRPNEPEFDTTCRANRNPSLDLCVRILSRWFRLQLSIDSWCTSIGADTLTSPYCEVLSACYRPLLKSVSSPCWEVALRIPVYFKQMRTREAARETMKATTKIAIVMMQMARINYLFRSSSASSTLSSIREHARWIGKDPLASGVFALHPKKSCHDIIQFRSAELSWQEWRSRTDLPFSSNFLTRWGFPRKQARWSGLLLNKIRCRWRSETFPSLPWPSCVFGSTPRSRNEQANLVYPSVIDSRRLAYNICPTFSFTL